MNDKKEIEQLKRRIFELECVILRVSTPFDFEDPAELARIAIQCYNIPIHGVKNEDRTVLN